MEEDASLLKRVKRIFSGTSSIDDDVAEEIISMVDKGHEDGAFVSNEAEMIRNIFEYGDKSARDIMTHRKNIVALDGDKTLEEVLTFILDQANSRFPIYEEDIDSIIGIIHLRDAMKCYFDKELRHVPMRELKDYIRPVSFVPETKSIDKLFKQMQLEKTHVVLVLDEYGQTAGLVAMEDIIEEIVGNILDEYDEEEEFIIAQEDGTFLVEGMTELKELEMILDITFDEEDYETLNGFIVFKIDHIPSEDELCEIDYHGYHFKVLNIENNTIKTVKIERIDKEH